ncbi:MAG TPA: NAD(P)-dependent alcohol dehydrogenase [Gaiellaceae bacterium]|nr:NAD(P)-dependent alcohol dehydrogenase [Gaiellaceae bacterium]
MKAIVQDRYGPPDVLRLAEVDRPAIGDDDVLVKVRAAGVDQGVWHLLAGLPYLVRVMGYGLRAPKTRIPGLDLAGTVEAAGGNVTGLRPGDEVFGTAQGSFAELASAPQDRLAPKPANLTFEQAAAVPISGYTALQAVRDQGKVEAGQHVLVVGAAGGVGSFAVQVAKAFGAEVTGVSSTAKTDLVLSLGADHVIDYTQEDFTAGTARYDVVLDTGGNRSLSDIRRVLAPAGTLVIVGGEGGGKWLGGFDRQLRAATLSPFVSQSLRFWVSQENQEDLQALRELIEAGKVTPAVDRTFPLDKAADAIRYLREGRARGKVVVTV